MIAYQIRYNREKKNRHQCVCVLLLKNPLMGYQNRTPCDSQHTKQYIQNVNIFGKLIPIEKIYAGHDLYYYHTYINFGCLHIASSDCVSMLIFSLSADASQIVDNAFCLSYDFVSRFAVHRYRTAR